MKWIFAFLMLFFACGCGSDPALLLFGIDILHLQEHENIRSELNEHTHESVEGPQGEKGEMGPKGDKGDSSGLPDSDNNVDCQKVRVCHRGHTIEICENALDDHLSHDDIEGECDE